MAPKMTPLPSYESFTKFFSYDKKTAVSRQQETRDYTPVEATRSYFWMPTIYSIPRPFTAGWLLLRDRQTRHSFMEHTGLSTKMAASFWLGNILPSDPTP